MLTQSLDPDLEAAAAAPLLSATTVDELDSLAAVLMSRFPGRRLAEVRDVVYEAYRRIASSARITAHLIPLTLNRARTIMMTREQEHGAS
ncbi:three-helix bundle dimerization domain-containing protein [Nocardia fluminea]|uniref:three-helix bundle dimerization domain-containing protein n=1 Tax=Nocardia fluminea TaxID=134984 RepID=UPI0037FBAC32